MKIALASTILIVNRINLKYALTARAGRKGQKFDSKEAYCSALQNDELNKGCAYSLRQKQFSSECK